jgi:hypothetical protein
MNNSTKITKGMVYIGYIVNFGISIGLTVNFSKFERRIFIGYVYFQTILVAISTFISILISVKLFCKTEDWLIIWEKNNFAFNIALYIAQTISTIGELWFLSVDNAQPINNLIYILLISSLLVTSVVFSFNILIYLKDEKGSPGKPDKTPIE